MKNQSTFVVVFIKGGKKIRLNSESEISQGLLDNYPNSVRAELYYLVDNEKRLIDTIYNQ